MDREKAREGEGRRWQERGYSRSLISRMPNKEVRRRIYCAILANAREARRMYIVLEQLYPGDRPPHDDEWVFIARTSSWDRANEIAEDNFLLEQPRRGGGPGYGAIRAYAVDRGRKKGPYYLHPHKWEFDVH